MKTPLRHLAALLFLTCFAGAQSLDLSGQDDDNAAGRAFARWANGLGYKATEIKDGMLVEVVLDSGLRAYAELTANVGGIDRVTLNISFRGENGTAHKTDKVELANRINSELKSCKVTVDGEGDFTYQFTLIFDDKLSPALLRKFLDHSNMALQLIRERYAKDFDRVGR